MLGAIARQLFGTANERYLKGLQRDVDAINAMEPELEGLSDGELSQRTPWLRQRLAGAEDLEDLLVDAFATVREAAKRTLGQRHFDVQLMGGIILHRGMIAEMKTGEGKTLVSTLPVYLNSLTGGGVHVVTVNDYLASRDAEWMGQIYKFLGIGVGCIVHGLDDDERREAYAADVTYGTNNELGFDYLRDNMKFSLEDMVQRPFSYAIVDEVDSILVDEARTPLIISGPTEDSSELYAAIDKLIPKLSEEDFEKDEKVRAVTYTESGTERIETLLREAGLLTSGALYDIANVSLVHHTNQALRAHKLFTRDTDYIVKDNKVIIIDEFTGRMMEGRRYSEGLHQALEAKESAHIEHENQTLASITFQNYFRLYPKLAGMTGTAMTEAGEFSEIYKLDVVEVPTNLPCIRDDMDDEVYRTSGEKDAAIIDLIVDCQNRSQPVLVGTVSIEKSEHLSALLKKRKIPHNVLNARYHEQEAVIIAQAGTPGTVTIATNMAGRGTDIQLGGHVDMRIAQELDDDTNEAEREKGVARIRAEVEAKKKIVIEAGGAFVLGTERHGKPPHRQPAQGTLRAPGRSRGIQVLPLAGRRPDAHLRSERIDSMLQKLGLEDGEAIIHPWVNKALEKAQQKVEARNFEISQEPAQVRRRDERPAQGDLRPAQGPDGRGGRDRRRHRHAPPSHRGHGRHLHTRERLPRAVGHRFPPRRDFEGLEPRPSRLRLGRRGRHRGHGNPRTPNGGSDRRMAEKAANYGPEVMRQVEKSLLLQILDQIWKDHLLNLDHLRQGIGLRAYGQRDPLNEYKRRSLRPVRDHAG